MSLYNKFKSKPLVHHLRALKYIIYSFIVKKIYIKLVKFTLEVKKDILISYNSKIIYYIQLLNKQKIEWLKDIKIYKGDISLKTITIFIEKSVDLFNK